MLNPDFSYVAFDFETTGLDVKKDEPIQIGIVKFDHTCAVIGSYSSLIQPKKNIKELKEIVRFITGFTLEDLEEAPYIEEIITHVSSFFDEKTVVVGHNIHFDVAILQKYMSFVPAYEIDTYIYAKALAHYKASYALDVLHTEVQKLKNMSTSVKYHDALADSYAALDIFSHYIERIHTLRRSYLLVDYVIQNSQGILKDIIKRTEKPFAFEQKKLFFPALKKQHSTNRKVYSKDTLALQPYIGKKMYVGKYTLKEFCRSIDRYAQKYVLSFTHRSKQHLTQQYLTSLGIETNTLHSNVIFNPDRVDNFLQKRAFSDEEVLFVCKYYSHFEQGISILDINSTGDYKIFNALTQQKQNTSSGVTLSTHTQLFQMGDNVHPDATVLFFDHDRRYTNRSKWMKQPFDPLHRIGLLEQMEYKATICKESEQQALLSDYVEQATIFVGVMSTEINQLFVNYTERTLQVDTITDHTRFPKTIQFFKTIQDIHQRSKTILSEGENKKLDSYRKKLSTYLQEPCNIEKKMYNGDKWYYVLHQRNLYLGYEDFTASLPQAKYIFLTNSDKSAMQTGGGNISPSLNLHTQSKPNKIIPELQKMNTAQFVFSTSKQASQELFNKLIALNIQKTYTIVGENITGGIGKNLYLAGKSEKPIICIGGYNFYLEALAQKFDFSDVYLYHLHGRKKEQLVHDILRYAS